MTSCYSNRAFQYVIWAQCSFLDQRLSCTIVFICVCHSNWSRADAAAAQRLVVPGHALPDRGEWGWVVD